MSTPTRPRRLRTWSALGELGRVPSDYEIVTHGLNYTFRPGRASALESNPTAPMNMWFLTYRDKSPLQADDWDGFRERLAGHGLRWTTAGITFHPSPEVPWPADDRTRTAKPIPTQRPDSDAADTPAQ